MPNFAAARRLAAVVLLVAIAAVATAACGSDSVHSAMGHDDTGMPMTHDGSQMGMGSTADLAFTQNMIPHHEQAVAMADLALDPAHEASPEVQDLAKRIKAAQTTEIADMRGWLKEWGADDTSGGMGMDHGDMGHSGMGMMGDAAMADLEQAKGAAFDRLWLTGMIEHHEGALTMADHITTRGEDARVQTLAGNIDTSQTAEIAEMKKLLGE